MATIITCTDDELVAEREELLRKVGMSSVEEFRRFADTYTLTGDEMHIMDLLDDVEFLLDGRR
jgi:hypothetical protein